jgi:DNA-binding transcriptional ArsR family regulator
MPFNTGVAQFVLSADGHRLLYRTGGQYMQDMLASRSAQASGHTGDHTQEGASGFHLGTAPVGRSESGAPPSPGPATCGPGLRLGQSPLIYNRMVVRTPLTDAELDRLFRALADTTRRDIVARLLAGEPASVSTLAARYDMSFAAVQKHVAVLEEAGLVSKQPQGRERIVRGNPERLARAREALTRLESLWRSRFSQLDAVLSQPKTKQE